MCGGSSTTTQSTTIPPEVLARYNAVNARAEQVAGTPFQPYSGQFVAPINEQQRLGIGGINQASGMAQPYINTATQALGSAYGLGAQNMQSGFGTMQNAYNQTTPMLNAALGTSSAAYGSGSGAMQQAFEAAKGLTNTGSPYLLQGVGSIQNAGNQAQPYYQQSGALAGQGLTQLNNMMGMAEGSLQNAVSQGQELNTQALTPIQGALSSAQPYMSQATQATQGGLGAAAPMMGAAESYLSGGTQAVNPQEFGQAQINKYMSPYMRNVIEAQQALQLQESAAQRSALNSQAIGAGAFGGDRAGIAQANLARQQTLANQATLSNLLNQGYSQAAGMFQQQQGVDLAAQQANRAAQQFGSQQAAALGQQRFGQQLGQGAQMAQLGAQQFGQQIGQGQALAGLGQQAYAQGLGAAQQAAGMGQARAAANMAAAQNAQGMAQGIFGMGATAGQAQQQAGQAILASNAQQQALQQQAAQGMFNMGQQAAQFQQGAAAQQFGMGAQLSGAQSALGQNLYNMGSQTGLNMANLGNLAQNAALQGAQAQIGAGTLEQQTQQAENTAQYQQFLQERGYPFQVAQFLANIAMGTGALSGSTTTTTQPGGFFSDRRLKKDIKEIGETHDGLPIYSFKYKNGDEQPRIGFMADEVREKHPDAVSRHNGIDSVNYEKVANRESEGGGVMPSRAGQGYAMGGGISEQDLAAILAMQKDFLGPHGQGGLYGQSPQSLPGGGGIVPQKSVHVSKLQPHSAPSRQASGLQRGMGTVNEIKDLGEKLIGEKGLFGEQGPGAKAVKYAQKVLAPETPKDQPKKQAPVGQTEATTGPTADASVAASPPAQIKTSDASAGVMPEDINREDLDAIFSSQFAARGGGIRPAFKFGGADIYKAENPIISEEILEVDTPKKIGEDASRGGGGGGSGSSGLSQAIGLAGSVASAGTAVAKLLPALMALIPSDERFKKDMEKVGELDNGQPVYKYKIGDGPTQIGLSAQNVSKYGDPSAVYRDKDGFMYLDYDRATREYGGGVRPGYATDGSVEGEPVDENEQTYNLLRKKEGFREKPYWDVNALRGGYGTDTFTAPDGTVQRVNENTRFTVEDAERDLRRRVSEFQGSVKSAIGEDSWAGLNPNSRAALTSVAYNYGSLPKPVAEAAASGDSKAIADAIYGLRGHNKGINAGRRAAEAALVFPEGGYASGVGAAPARRQVAGAESVVEGGKRQDYVEGRPVSRGGIEPPINYRTGKPYESWGDFATSRQMWIPLLSGLGAAAGSQNRYALGAIAEGIGAAANSYAGLERPVTEGEQTRAQTAGQTALTEATYRTIANRALNVDQKTGIILGVNVYINGKPATVSVRDFNKALAEGRPYSLDPRGTIYAREPIEEKVGVAGGAGAGISQGAAGEQTSITRRGQDAAEPGAPAYRALDQGTQDIVKKNAAFIAEGGVENLSPNDFSINPFPAAAIKSSEARNTLPQRNMYANAFATIDPSNLGSFQQSFLLPTKNYVNDMLRSAGVNFQIGDPNDLTNAQVIQKISTLLASSREQGAGQRSYAGFEKFLTAVPTVANNPEAAAALLADMYVTEQMNIDKDNYLNKVKDYARDNGLVYNENYLQYIGRGLDNKFTESTAQQYAKEKTALSNMMFDNITVTNKQTGEKTQIPVLQYLTKNAANVPPAIQRELEKTYGRDILRYFSGR